MKQVKASTITIFLILIFSSMSFAMNEIHYQKIYNLQKLTIDEQKALRQEKLHFLKKTRKLKIKIFNTKLNLDIMLASEHPDADAVKFLQKKLDISIRKLQIKKRNLFKKINKIVSGLQGMDKYQIHFTTRYQDPPIIKNNPI